MNNPVNQNEQPELSTPKRGNNRDSLLVKAKLRFPNSGEEREVRVRNISSGGLMAEAPLRSPRGDTVEVNLRNIGWVTGKVAWIAEARFGISFDYPIDPKAMAGKEKSSFEVPHYLSKLDAAQSKVMKKIRPL